MDFDKVEELVRFRIRNLELYPYFRGIVLSNDINVVANYNERTGIISFNPDSIDNYLNKLLKNSKINKELYKEFYYKFVLYHEIRHIYQSKLIDSNDDSLLKRLLVLDDNNLDGGLAYYLLHGCYVCERDAYLNALEELEIEYRNSSIIRNINVKKMSILMDGYNLRTSYYVVCPREKLNDFRVNINNCMNKVNKMKEMFDECNTLNLYTRLYYGLPISVEEYAYINGLNREGRVLVK